MSNKYNIYDYYGNSFSKSEIEDQIVFTLQNRLMNMSDSFREELDIDEDFLDRENLYDLLRAGRIYTTYNERKNKGNPLYHIGIDLNGDGIGFNVPNTLKPEVGFMPQKTNYIYKKDFTQERIKQNFYNEKWLEVKNSLPFGIRDTLDSNPSLESFLQSSYNIMLTYDNFNWFLTDKVKRYAKEGLEDNPLLGWFVNGLANLDPSQDKRISKITQDTQRDWLKTQMLMKNTNFKNELEFQDQDILINKSNNTMLAENFIYNHVVIQNEGAYSQKIFSPTNEWITVKNSAASDDQKKSWLMEKGIKDGKEIYINDPTIGRGLSLNDKWVVNKLQENGYTVEDIFNGKKLPMHIGEKISYEYLKVKQDELVNYFGEELLTPRNSPLLTILLDLSYASGFVGSDTEHGRSFIGKRMKPAVFKALKADTLEDKRAAMGNFNSYIEFPEYSGSPSIFSNQSEGPVGTKVQTDIQGKYRRQYIGYDNKFFSYEDFPNATISQELFNDGRANIKYFNRFNSNAELGKAWLNGQHGNWSLPNKLLDSEDIDGMKNSSMIGDIKVTDLDG